MASSFENRLARLEAITTPAARFVVAVCGSDETPQQAVTRETAGCIVDENTLVCCIRLFTTAREDFLRRNG